MLNPLAEPFTWNEDNYVTNTENIKNSDLDNEIDSFKALEQLRITNTNRIIIGHINVNSSRTNLMISKILIEL